MVKTICMMKRFNEEDQDKASKKPRLSLSLNRKSRFVIVDSPERKKAAEGVTPTNTRLSNEWFERNLQSWIQFRKVEHPSEPVIFLVYLTPTSCVSGFVDTYRRQEKKMARNTHHLLSDNCWLHFSVYFVPTRFLLIF